MPVVFDNDSATGRPTFTLATGVAEQTVFTSVDSSAYIQTGNRARRVTIKLDLTTLTQSNTLRLYERVDGTNYILAQSIAWTTASLDVQTFTLETADAFRVTMQAGVDETLTRAIPWRMHESIIL